MYAWVLNLDADLELEAGDRPYAPSARTRDAMAPHVARLAATLLADGDLLVGDDVSPGAARGYVGRAFCPTRRALSLLARAGATLEPTPAMHVLRRVNSRAFSHALGPTLPGAMFANDLDAALEALRRPPPVGTAWRLKGAFGMAGRNQRVVPASSPDGHDLVFLRRAFTKAHGGVLIEPDVHLEDEFAKHAFLAASGELSVGALVRQRCDARGAWEGTERIARLDDALTRVDARMSAEMTNVAGALKLAGYFGPFGVDAFLYRDVDSTRLQPRSEINARYSMGYPVGCPREPAPPR